jgi:hypothetical protein
MRSPVMLVVLAAIVVGGAVSLWLLLGGNGGAPIRGSTPSAVATASKADAIRFARAFAGARVDHRTVDAYLTRKVAAQYRSHAGGLQLYRYASAGHPPADVTGYSLFHVERLGRGNYLVALDLELAGGSHTVREEVLLLGPGKNPRGRSEPLVIRQAQLHSG